MKITIFNGSPRGKESNSHLIAEPFLAAAKEAGAETTEVFLMEKDIKYCRGCFDCWIKTPGICVIKDEMKELLDLYLESDFVGLATPVYGMLMTALMKNFTDRFLPLATPHIRRNEDGTFYHEGRVKRFPSQFYIANSGFPGAHNFEMLKAYNRPQNFIFEIYRNSGEILQTPVEGYSEIEQEINKFKDALHKAGRELTEKGTVSQQTLADIHRELVSDDKYMAEANKHWDKELSRGDKQ